MLTILFLNAFFVKTEQDISIARALEMKHLQVLICNYAIFERNFGRQRAGFRLPYA